MSRPNQFTKAAEEGREPPKGENHFTTGKRDRKTTQERARLRATLAADKLERYINGEIEMSPAQVTAARALMDKGIASLQAVETTELDPVEGMTEEEAENMVRALILANPRLIQSLGIGLRGASPVADGQQSRCSIEESTKAA